MRTPPKRRRRGFTLLELVIVLIILATIAGLVIPQLGFLGRSADMAATAKTQQDIANQIGLYFTLQKRFPLRCDSLLEGAGGATAPTGVIAPTTKLGVATTNAEQQGWGLPLAGAQSTNVWNQLVMTDLQTIGANSARSFVRAGFQQLMDHVPWTNGINANNSGVNVRADLTSGGPVFVARVASVTNGEVLGAAVGQVPPNGITRTIYPTLAGALPDGVTALVAVGIGPANSMVPDTMLNAPSYPGAEFYYGRYLAIFAIYGVTGERCQLVGVCDAYGRFPNYSQQQFNESLPNNGRQG